MKKLILILAVLVVAFASCERKNIHQPKDNSTENTAGENSSFWKTLDLCYVENGKLFFYSIKDDDAAQFVNETDSILDALYSKKDGMLYYNVVKDDYLVLKCLDLNDTDPMPEQLVEWGVPVNVGEQYYPQQYGDMYFNYEKTQIALEKDVNWFAGMYYNLAVYDCASKTVKTYQLYRVVDLGDDCMTMEDLPDESGFDRWGQSNPLSASGEPLFAIGDQVYYVGDGNHTCLTDRIDFEQGFGIGTEEGFDLNVCGIDPTGKKALIAAYMYMGDGEIGFYMASSLDGKMQMELPGSSYGESEPEWLPDGSLAFLGYIDEVGIYLMDPDNNIRFVAASDIFCVLH